VREGRSTWEAKPAQRPAAYVGKEGQWQRAESEVGVPFRMEVLHQP
jgi:hypothetical protein